MIAVRMIRRQLSHLTQESLRQFLIDLTHCLWLIGYLMQTLTYPGTMIDFIVLSHA